MGTTNNNVADQSIIITDERVPKTDFRPVDAGQTLPASDNGPLPAFRQASTDPETQPISYTLQLSLDAGFTQPFHRARSKSPIWRPPATRRIWAKEIANDDYYWRVIATDGGQRKPHPRRPGNRPPTRYRRLPCPHRAAADLGDHEGIEGFYGTADSSQTLSFYQSIAGAAPPRLSRSTNWCVSDAFYVHAGHRFDPDITVWPRVLEDQR
ncbi:MAG: hypothetical protein M5U33_12095 [Pseudorhodoplanes sp.]|nr:hypothetical protein [Pseudorhodoplanes sp.]